MRTNKWVQGGSWHIRKPDGVSVNLNTEHGASYVLSLLARLLELESAAVSKRRRKPGPSETKHAVGHS